MTLPQQGGFIVKTTSKEGHGMFPGPPIPLVMFMCVIPILLATYPFNSDTNESNMLEDHTNNEK
jgi:hypothetical protein